MFSSSNPFPQFNSSTNGHVCPSSFTHDTDEIFLHHSQDLFSNNFFQSNNFTVASPFMENASNCNTSLLMGSTKATMANEDHVKLQLKGDRDPHCDPLECVIAAKKSSTAKRDRHSKIFTAQGLRDRRVRLSIEIARKFFTLQDLLGFDKASKTLDWLFTNSKIAIEELVEMKGALSNSSTNSECELHIFSGAKRAAEQNEGAKGVLVSMQKSETSGEAKKMREHSNKPASHRLAKESREKARARARERTQEKQRTREMIEFKKQYPNHHVLSSSPGILSHSTRSSGGIGVPSSKVNAELHSSPLSGVSLANHEASWKDIAVDAIANKRQPLRPFPIYIYHQNLSVPENRSSEISYSPCIKENWDMSSDD
uniref:Cycloidea-like protein n=1 Tax=Lobelia chinensis TaxID=368926 RepID=A0A346D3D6_9ASTR|nr:cycloidea-like protein [Lobelia chinensis]